MSYQKTLQHMVALVIMTAFLPGCAPQSEAPVIASQAAPPVQQEQSTAAQPTNPQPTIPQSDATQPPATQANTVMAMIPEDWTLSTDPSGKCQVATPPDWQLGTDFFMESGQAAHPMEGIQGSLPLSGLDLWGVQNITDLPMGHRFQIRTSLVIDDRVCSVWQIKADTDFTAEESALMEQVGQTLQEVP